jgi:hypothetical protein
MDSFTYFLYWTDKLTLFIVSYLRLYTYLESN